MVERVGNGTTTGHNELFENEHFEGSENPFVFENYYDLIVRCNFDFLMYPFDLQVCTLDVSNISFKFSYCLFQSF